MGGGQQDAPYFSAEIMDINLPESPSGAKYQVEYRAFPSGKGGAYYLDGKRTKRVTTITAKFPDTKGGLIDWARECVALTAARLLKDRVSPGSDICSLPAAEIDALVNLAYKNPDDIKDETADTGTAVHAFIDEWLKDGASETAKAAICAKYMLPDNPGRLELMQRQIETKDMTDAERNLFYDKMKSYMFHRFCEFWGRSGLTYEASELVVGSRKYGYAGRIDILARNRKRGLVLLDFKTSKHVSPAYFAQVALYKTAYEEQTGEKIGKCAIVQCPREWTEQNMGFGVYPVKVAPYKAIGLFLVKTWEHTEFKAADCRKETL